MIENIFGLFSLNSRMDSIGIQIFYFLHNSRAHFSTGDKNIDRDLFGISPLLIINHNWCASKQTDTQRCWYVSSHHGNRSLNTCISECSIIMETEDRGKCDPKAESFCYINYGFSILTSKVCQKISVMEK